MQNKQNESDSESSVERHVDEMMDVRRQSPQPISRPTEYERRSVLPPIDIFSDPSTAPEVSAEVAEQMRVQPEEKKEPSAEPAVAAAIAIPASQIDTDDEGLEKAIDDIVKQEANDTLDAEAEKPPAEIQPAHPQQPLTRRMLHTWWHNKAARYGSFIAFGLLIAGLGIAPTTRNSTLNLVGVRATASIQVLDETNKLPLKNVVVDVGSVEAVTDKNGTATLANIKLGTQTLVVHKIAFQTVTHSIKVGLGQNNLNQISLLATGDQYSFVLTNFLSNKPLDVAAEVSSGQASALADKTGKAVLTVGDTNASSLSVKVAAEGYRTEELTVPLGSSADISVHMVPATKSVFISKASGTYDVYKIDADGTNKKLLLAGTGRETSNLSLVANSTGSLAALVSTRDQLRNNEGYLLQALNLIDIDSGRTLSIDHSEQIQIVGWSGEKIVYVRIKAGASAGNPERYQLISYDYNSGLRLELAHANGFNDVVLAKGAIYYAASNNYDGGSSLLGKINADNTGKQTIVNEEVMNIFRPDYFTLNFSALKDWYTDKLSDNSVSKLNAAPATGTKNIAFLDSPDGFNAAWVDTRDGQGTLLVHGVLNNSDTVVSSAVGLTYPVRWLTNDTLIYRVVSPQETADYAVSINGGNPHKITDVTNAAGLASWYYY